MPGRFVASSAAEVQQSIQGPLTRHLEAYGRNVERIARRVAPRGYQNEAGTRNPGELKRSVYRTPTEYGPSSIKLIVGASARNAMTIHQGHRIIRPKTSKYLRFQFRDGAYFQGKRIRAVGGYPFLFAALKEANNALPPDARFAIVIKKKPRNDAPPARLAPLDWET